MLRTPPQDLQAEQAVLGAMLTSKDAISEVVAVLKTRDFYSTGSHGAVFDTILDLYGRGEPADAITVNAEMTRAGTINRIGGAPYLHTLISSVPSVANAGHYAGIVREQSVLRRIIQAGDRISQLGYGAAEGNGLDPDEVVDRAQREVYELTDGATEDGMSRLDQMLQPMMDELDSIESRGDALAGIATGITDLDQLTRGLLPGQLVVVAARPGVGKSTLALGWSLHAAIRLGLPVLFFSLEMSKSELTMKVLSSEAKIPLHDMRAGRMDDAAWARLARRMGEVADAPLYIDDSPNMTVGLIRAKARRLKQQVGLRMIVVDYLQLLSTGRRAETRQLEVAELSRSLKLLGKELQVPVVALAQLNRGPEQRTDRRPVISDLRDSGALEQDCDLAILVYREDMHEKESPRAGEADLIVAKHRGGPTATVTVAFQGHYSRFVNMASSGT